MNKLIPQDIVERRAKCDVCGHELTLAEFLISGCFCIWHEKDENKLKQLNSLSKLAYVRRVLADLDVVRGKLALKARGLDHVDYMAVIGEFVDEIQHAGIVDMKKIVNHMKMHGRNHANT